MEKNTNINIRISPVDKKKVKQLCDRLGLTTSEYLRLKAKEDHRRIFEPAEQEQTRERQAA